MSTLSTTDSTVTFILGSLGHYIVEDLGLLGFHADQNHEGMGVA